MGPMAGQLRNRYCFTLQELDEVATLVTDHPRANYTHLLIFFCFTSLFPSNVYKYCYRCTPSREGCDGYKICIRVTDVAIHVLGYIVVQGYK